MVISKTQPAQEMQLKIPNESVVHAEKYSYLLVERTAGAQPCNVVKFHQVQGLLLPGINYHPKVLS